MTNEQISLLKELIQKDEKEAKKYVLRQLYENYFKGWIGRPEIYQDLCCSNDEIFPFCEKVIQEIASWEEDPEGPVDFLTGKGAGAYYFSNPFKYEVEGYRVWKIPRPDVFPFEGIEWSFLKDCSSKEEMIFDITDHENKIMRIGGRKERFTKDYIKEKIGNSRIFLGESYLYYISKIIYKTDNKGNRVFFKQLAINNTTSMSLT